MNIYFMRKFLGWMLLALSTENVLAEEISIDQAVLMALEHSPQVKVVEHEKKAQENKQVSAWLDLGPRLSASFNGALFDGKQTVKMGDKEILMRDDVTKTGNIMLSQPITGLFALSQNARLEGKQNKLKGLNLQLTRAQTAFKTAELYLNVQKSTKMWEVAEASIQAREAPRGDGAILLRVGRINHGDFLKLELAVSEARVAEAKARAQRDIAHFSLMELIGHPNPDQVSIQPLDLLNVSEPVPSLDEALTMALSNRLEVAQAVQGQEIASLARIAPLVKFIPSVNFFAQIDRNFGTVGMGGKEQSKMLGLTINWEFWNSGSHIFQIREANQTYAKTKYQTDAVRQSIRLDLMQSMLNLRAAQESFSFANLAIEQADESYRMEKIKFASGKSSATELVLAETAKTLAHGNAIAIFTELKSQELKLQQALGKTRPEL
jgi:outer membrane protein TolC